jgi:uncharacterized protein (DUF2147 family)
MATKKKSDSTPDEFVEAEVAEVVEETTEAPAKVVAPGAPETKKGRVKGTWRMHWGSQIFDFEDGKTYDLPVGLHDHLRTYGNIYDTL